MKPMIAKFKPAQSLAEFRRTLHLLLYDALEWLDPCEQGDNAIDIQFNRDQVSDRLDDIRLVLMDGGEWLAYQDWLSGKPDQGDNGDDDDDDPIEFNVN